jgi:hypothetical protein
MMAIQKWRKLKKASTLFETYDIGDIVIHEGVTYIARRKSTGRINPEINSYVTNDTLRYWDLYAGRPDKIDGGFF